MKNFNKSWGQFLFGLFFVSFLVGQEDTSLKNAVNNSDRNINYSARDEYRNPYETLSFFRIKPDMHVLELAAGGGWYTEILAPYLKNDGMLSVTQPTLPECSYGTSGLCGYLAGQYVWTGDVCIPRMAIKQALALSDALPVYDLLLQPAEESGHRSWPDTCYRHLAVPVESQYQG